ncbi:hypothetical protein [Streptomyces sp. NBC_00328]|uniref:hypothetical protein n=1 Tax=Streptomyces sp. NBC_00328 TaxID=2903646 RepID=UPI002E2DA95A|nr:hypothetical protein [Streptomyces sp. NBC_00328]
MSEPHACLCHRSKEPHAFLCDRTADGWQVQQCDFTPTFPYRGTRSYVLLDGIGSSGEVRDRARATARRLVRAAAKEGAERGLRAVHSAIAAAPRASRSPRSAASPDCTPSA